MPKPSKKYSWPITSWHADRSTVCGPTSATRERKNYPETDASGQFWRATMLDMDTRLRVARGIAKTETQAATEVFI